MTRDAPHEYMADCFASSSTSSAAAGASSIQWVRCVANTSPAGASGSGEKASRTHGAFDPPVTTKRQVRLALRHGRVSVMRDGGGLGESDRDAIMDVDSKRACPGNNDAVCPSLKEM